MVRDGVSEDLIGSLVSLLIVSFIPIVIAVCHGSLKLYLFR